MALFFKDHSAQLDDTESMIKEPCTPVGVFNDLEEARLWLSALAVPSASTQDHFREYYRPTYPARASIVPTNLSDFVTLEEVRSLIDKALSLDRNEKERSMLAAARRELLHVPDTVKFSLTPIELDIVECMACGMTTKRIAEHQKKSFRTVEIQKQVMYRKVGATNAAELVQKIKDWGLLKKH